MNIEDCRIGMKVTSVLNPYIRYYEICQVFKKTIWVFPKNQRGNIYKGLNPEIFMPIPKEKLTLDN